MHRCCGARCCSDHPLRATYPEPTGSLPSVNTIGSSVARCGKRAVARPAPQKAGMARSSDSRRTDFCAHLPHPCSRSHIAFWAGLDDPRWSFLTVFVVSQPDGGLVLAKSFYRILGTIAGVLVTIALVFGLSQYGDLFVAAVLGGQGMACALADHVLLMLGSGGGC